MMIITLGVVLIGGHFLASGSIALIASLHFGELGMYLFLSLSTLFGAAILRLQTRLERYFIRKHVARRPRSWWNVIDTSCPAQRKGTLQSTFELGDLPSWKGWSLTWAKRLARRLHR